MELAALWLWQQLISGLLGKFIGIGLIFSGAQNALNLWISVPNPLYLNTKMKITLVPEIHNAVIKLRKRFSFSLIFLWLLIPIYLFIYFGLENSIPAESATLTLNQTLCVFSLIPLALLSLGITVRLNALASHAKNLVQIGQELKK